MLQDVLCFGITSDAVVVRSKTETVLACAPTLTQVTLVDLSLPQMLNYRIISKKNKYQLNYEFSFLYFLCCVKS